jgi:nucleoside-diphosphate-sugar epimerase
MAASLRVPLYPAESAAKPVKVAVTGATGYVAGPLIQRLLASGHTINATVRNPDDSSKISHLTALPGAADRLKFFKADLTDATSFDAAISGCKYVFHVASPFNLNVKPADVEEKLVGPAVSGVENVLAAVSRAGADTVERVVMTSSIVAMVGDNWEHGKDHVLNEADWNNSASPTFMPYPLSKTLAEKKAWEIFEEAKKDGKSKWSLCTINPGFVLGPPLNLSSGESIDFCTQMLAGNFKAATPKLHLACVDVDDVAAAHVLAALTPTASGRYLCVSEATDLLTLVKDTEQEFTPPRKFAGPAPPGWLLWVLCKVFRVMPYDQVKASLNKPQLVENSKIKKELGMTFIEGKKTLGDMAKRIEELQAAAVAK